MIFKARYFLLCCAASSLHTWVMSVKVIALSNGVTEAHGFGTTLLILMSWIKEGVLSYDSSDPGEFIFNVCTSASEISVDYRQRNREFNFLCRNHITWAHMNHSLKFFEFFFLLITKRVWSSQLKPSIWVSSDRTSWEGISLCAGTLHWVAGNILVLGRAQNQD